MLAIFGLGVVELIILGAITGGGFVLLGVIALSIFAIEKRK
jgi:hypothetical protein